RCTFPAIGDVRDSTITKAHKDDQRSIAAMCKGFHRFRRRCARERLVFLSAIQDDFSAILRNVEDVGGRGGHGKSVCECSAMGSENSPLHLSSERCNYKRIRYN